MNLTPLHRLHAYLQAEEAYNVANNDPLRPLAADDLALEVACENALQAILRLTAAEVGALIAQLETPAVVMAFRKPVEPMFEQSFCDGGPA